MEFQYLDGMFLGKQELERIRDIGKAELSPLRHLLRVTSDDPDAGIFGRPYNPKFMHLKIESRTVGSAVGVAVGLDPTVGLTSTEVQKLGRGVIGSGLGACVLDDEWTGKEGWKSLDTILTDGTYYIQIRYASTHYENALISVDSNGLCTFPKGWKYVENQFRNSDFGRQTRIYIVGGGTYAVASVNTTNHTVQLVGEAGSFPVLTDKQFGFKPTMSPFVVAGTDEFIYSYWTLDIQFGLTDAVPTHPWYTVGSIVVSGGAVTSVSVFDCETGNNKYGYLDTVSENQINTRHLIDGCVTNDKLADNIIQGSKLADGSVSKAKLASESVSTAKLEDNAVTLSKVAKYGVLPTDIFRVDLHTVAFNLDSSGLGCLIVQGENNNFFAYDASYPDNPYRLRVYYNSNFPKILAFYPINRMIVSENNRYSIAAPFVHFNEDGITCQVILFLSETTYNSMYTSGYRVLKGTIDANVYDDQKATVNYNIALNRTNYLNITFSQASLLAKNYQHIVLDIEMEAAAS